jgi:hypothetical protein
MASHLKFGSSTIRQEQSSPEELHHTLSKLHQAVQAPTLLLLQPNQNGGKSGEFKVHTL